MKQIGESTIPYNLGEVYSEGVLKNLFDELKNRGHYQVKLKLTEHFAEFKCTKECKFFMMFVKQIGSQGEIAFLLTEMHVENSSICENNLDEVLFEDALRFIYSHRKLIESIVLNFPFSSTPTTILNIMAKKLKIPENFLKAQIGNLQLRRKIKKTFDNFVGDVKKHLYETHKLMLLESESKKEKSKNKSKQVMKMKKKKKEKKKMKDKKKERKREKDQEKEKDEQKEQEKDEEKEDKDKDKEKDEDENEMSQEQILSKEEEWLPYYAERLKLSINN